MKMKRKVNKNWRNSLKYWEFYTTILNQLWVKKFLRLKVYKTLALPILSYGSETWTLRKKDKKKD
jgi:capsular polysaccharide biosynthesis protein